MRDKLLLALMAMALLGMMVISCDGILGGNYARKGRRSEVNDWKTFPAKYKGTDANREISDENYEAAANDNYKAAVDKYEATDDNYEANNWRLELKFILTTTQTELLMNVME